MRPAPVLCLLLALWGPARAEEARLAILHTTDLHGALTAYDYLADRPAARGLVKLASMVEEARREGVPTLLLDAGDCIQGGAIESVYRQGAMSGPEPMMTAMTRMRYDALAVGNHEFSFGLSALGRARDAAGFPWLAANIVHASSGRRVFEASMVKSLGPLRVGVVGLCTPAVPFLEDSAHHVGLRFLSPVEAARPEVERLRVRERCDLVVILAHTGLGGEASAAEAGVAPDEDWGRRLASQVPGVDLVILGHTHQVIPTLEIGSAVVTQAGRWGEHLGRVDVTFTRETPQERWKLASRRARVLAVADTTPVHGGLQAFSEPYHRTAQAELGRVIGRAEADIEAPRGRFKDGALWELIHLAQLHATGAEVSLATLPDPTARIERGPITQRDMLRLYPYDNSLGVVELTGRELKQTLEWSARCLAEYTFEAERPITEPGMHGYNFTAAEGVGYEIDLTRPAGDRIVNLTFRGEPLAPERRLRVAANGYQMSGGGGFEAVRDAPRLHRSPRRVRDLVAEYVRRAGTLDGSFKPNWRLLPDFAPAPERGLIDLLVRQGVLSRSEVHRLLPGEPARRGDLAYWLARAFEWREEKLSGAFADAPDSLEPWLDGLLERGVLGEEGSSSRFHPFDPARLSLALDWCERAARHEDYSILPMFDQAFREGLLNGVSIPSVQPGGFARSDTLTRSQALGIVANARYPSLRILETTDFHGAILASARDRLSGREIGGSAVLAAHIERLRADNPQGTLLVDGGDAFQGTMISNLQFGRPVVDQMNALGYAAMAIGNHEFDWSADTLERRVREMQFAALGANMVDRKTGRMPSWVRSDTVIVRRGVRVGILGLCYRATPTVTLARHVQHLWFADDSATAAHIVPGLRSRSDVVIGVGHVPASSDSADRATGGDLVRLARGIRGVAAWFGGHQHNRVADHVGGVPVLISGSRGQVIGVCDLVVDPIRDRVVESRARLVDTFADEVVPDSAMQARIDNWNAAVAPLAARQVGRNARTLERGSRSGEATVGNLVADAIRTAARADIALQNSGGLRANLEEGEVTMASIYEVMPFDNLIVTLDLTGREVKEALEQGLRRGRVTQVSGIRYSFDPMRPEWQRVVSLTDANNQPLVEDRVYRVACNDFMATGGDEYNVLSQAPNRTFTDLLVRDVIEAYVAERSRDGGALNIRPDGRIQRTGGAPPDEH